MKRINIHWRCFVVAIAVCARLSYAADPIPSAAQDQASVSSELEAAIAAYRNHPDRGSQFSAYPIRALAQKGNTRAYQWLVQEAELGVLGANSALGYYWSEKGDGRKAVVHFEVSAKGGDASIASRLGGILYDGEMGVPVDEKNGCAWYKVAAEAGRKHAQTDYGYKCLMKPAKGYKKNDVEACQWFEKAASSWLADSLENPAVFKRTTELGRSYSASAGHAFGLYSTCFRFIKEYNSRSTEESAWLKRASEFGNDFATFYYGELLELGRGGVAQNYEEAVRWYRQAADAGIATSQNRLGTKYAEGKGVSKNMLEAMKWFIIAAANGDDMAVENRDKAEKSLSAADVKKAQGLAADWMKKNNPK